MKLNSLLLLTGFLTFFSTTFLPAQSNYATPYSFITLAGEASDQGGGGGSTDGSGSTARFNYPSGVALDGSGNIYVGDTDNITIRKITPGGLVTTLAGTAGQTGSSDGTGSAALFDYPSGVAVDGSGNVYVGDGGNSTIRKITPGGVVTTLAGAAGQTGSTDGTGSAARFNNPEGLAVDGGGNLYVADVGNETIRKITPGGVVSTLAGAAGQYGSSDGTGSAARFYNPSYVAVDGSGNVFVSDLGNYIIRKITPGGVVTTLAGTAGQTGSSDGSGSAARFGSGGFLGGVAVDGSDNVYVADSSTIRQIAPGGVVTTLAGTAGQYGSTDGTGSAARFRFPGGIAVDVSNRVYVADSYNDTIRKGTPPLDLFSGSVVGANLKLSPWFGYYAYGVYPLVYEYNLGYEYTFDAGSGGVYLYDYTSGHFWYTQSTYFPFVYDFSLNCFLYYYQANTPHRHFYSYGTNAVITE